jgi:hypothetical protein
MADEGIPPRQPKYSRWRRLPGVRRISEYRLPHPDVELQRLTLYLPGGLLDRAEKLAARVGAESVQAYCEVLLAEAIENASDRDQATIIGARQGTLGGLDAIANDPDYLAEWSASAAPPPPPPPENTANALPPPEAQSEEPMDRIPAEEVILRHATLVGDDPRALLATLRRGEVVDPDSARELLQALIDLERAYRDRTAIGRRLAYALHRLAFEGQVLLTDAWPAVPADPGTVDVLRIVQEAVDRVLSGEDIRYYGANPPS